MSHKELTARFYQAFQKRDAATMTELYHPDVNFQDEVFQLKGRDLVGGMWSMLCAKGKDMELEFEIGAEKGDLVEVNWTAKYSFSLTGRQVVNRIKARIIWRDGLIYDHRDRFNFWLWSRQALGLPGLLLGWTPFLRAKVRKQAQSNLNSWLAKQS